MEFPYPSGEGLHVGHVRGYTAMDVVARKRRAEGYEVLYPIGWDAFGLPTENYAIKTGIAPAVITKRNTDRYRKQLKSLGYSFDWSREINTTDPNYYKWTQWLFLQFFKNGLAYKKAATINWCPSCKIGLANEEAVNGKCERCGAATEQREKEQWMLAITKYADRLDKDLDLVDFTDSVKTQQRNWIVNMRDWIFSRQRYWGEPIPLVWCEKCGKWQPVPDKELPVKLPKVKRYQPTETGESPLASIEKWVKTKCPVCKGPARRETDTMPNWAGSSWYYLAYIMRGNPKSEFRNSNKVSSFLFRASNFKKWLPVDWYNGGMEHTTLHLLYSRFWHKFFYDLGLVPSKEPYQKRTSHGLILAEGGEKMSKSKGNVVNPDEIVKRYGADTLRVYEMFMGPFDQAIAWGEAGLVGAQRFLERVWRLQEKILSTKHEIRNKSKIQNSNIQNTIKKVGEDIEAMKFNTAISALMIQLNEFEKLESVNKKDWQIFLKLLSPFAPHITDELWSQLGDKKSIHIEPWPQALKSTAKTVANIVVQVNGKMRATIEVPTNASESEVKAVAEQDPKIALWLKDKTIQKIIFVPNRLLNFVI